MEFVWLLFFVALIILEIATTQFICIWFAGGAFAAFICALLKLSIPFQLISLVLVSLILLISTNKIVSKLRKKTSEKTNTDALIGQSAVVTEDISNLREKGAVKIRGLEWSARSADGNEIAADSYVTVKEIDGVKLIVDLIK